MISTDPLPDDFGKVGSPFETHDLRVARLAVGDQLYWVFDRDGFVCSCSTLEELDHVLSSEANGRASESSLPYWTGIRWRMNPEAVEAWARGRFLGQGSAPSTHTRSRGRAKPSVPTIDPNLKGAALLARLTGKTS